MPHFLKLPKLLIFFNTDVETGLLSLDKKNNSILESFKYEYMPNKYMNNQNIKITTIY